MSELHLKIHQGTGRLTGEHLCKSCRYSHILVDRGGEHFYCEQMGPDQHVNGVVTECNRYKNQSLPTLQDLYASAWTLRTEKDGRKIGFEAPKRGFDGAPE